MCVACVGHARRVQTTVQESQSDRSGSDSLASLLLATSPAAAVARGQHAPVTSAASTQNLLQRSPMNSILDHGKDAIAATMIAAMLVATPAFAGVPEAAKDLTDASYPIIASLKKDTVGPLASKAVGVALTASPQEIIKTIDAGLDAFLSTPADKFIATVKVLKAATAEAATASSCNLICMPSLETSEKVGVAAADALSQADPAKLKAFANQAIKLVNSADKMAAAPLLMDGAKFAGSLNPGDVSKATAAALEVAKASGAL